ncbi:MAG: hypothetical protein QM790_19620 [Nibricoccus sp.]
MQHKRQLKLGSVHKLRRYLKMNRIFANWLLVAGVLRFSTLHSWAVGANVITQNGYNNCIELTNGVVRVVLEPNLGGRVIVFSLNGINALYQNADYDGKTQATVTMIGHVPGGRFDVGPEFAQPRHPVLWIGAWRAEITGSYSARLTSEVDPQTGLQIIREFSLEEGLPHLECRQIIANRSESERSACHWGRTFVPGGGICLLPLNPQSRYPAGYAAYVSGSASPFVTVQFRPPSDPHVRVREQILEVLGQPNSPKIVVDSNEGWLAYIGKNGLLFIKRFEADPHMVSGEPAGNSTAIWFDQDRICELEPIGPLVKLAPGACTSFTEHWWLYEAPPALSGQVELNEVRERLRQSASR